MTAIRISDLRRYVRDLMERQGLSAQDCETMAEIYTETTLRGVGHHDIHNLPSRIEALRSGRVQARPSYQKLASLGALERWDGGNGLGELINHFSMQRAIDLAQEHGMGLCTVRNSNHYLCSAPFVTQAARQGCIGLIIAKGVPTMGMPGIRGNLVGQSPMGFAFPVGGREPVMLDICLAYASGEQLVQRANHNIPVPSWWGVDRNGAPTTSAAELLKGTKYPIGEHKGFGLAILCELLTGVLSGGLILDQDADREGIASRSTSHTAIAIRTDALLSEEEYAVRSQELIQRIQARASDVHIPGDSSWEKQKAFEKAGAIPLEESLPKTLNGYAQEFCIEPLISG